MNRVKVKQFKFILIVLPLVVLTACHSSKLTSSWKAPGMAKNLSRYKNVLVVGMQGDRQLKEVMENSLTEDLKKQEINATASFDVFGPKAFSQLSEDAVADKVRAKGYDGVMTIALLDRSKEENYISGNINYAPIGPFYSRFGLYYSNIYSRIYNSGYYTTSTNYFWETNLYDIKKDQIVYSAQSKTYYPGSFESMSSDYGKLIVTDLEKSGFIGAGR